MVQLNLLPDVKIKYIKAQRSKRTVLLSAVIISGAAIGIVLLLASVVYGAQSLQLSGLENDIKDNTKKLQQVENLDKILTIQNQLGSLEGLHNEKPVMSRIYSFLPQLTPVDVNVSSFKLNTETNTIEIMGSTKDLGSVNKFVDTLKFTKYTTGTDTDQKTPFTSVVLTTFARSDKGATYSITAKYDPELFNDKNTTVTLVVPKITTTRSETERPGVLFKEQPVDQTGGSN